MATELPEIVVDEPAPTVGAEPGGGSGVPLLQGGDAVVVDGPGELLTADSIGSIPLIFGQQWGVFLNGAPVIVFDTFLDIDFRESWNLSDYPVERGAFESYNKVFTPFETRVSFATGGSASRRKAMLDSVAAIAGTLVLYDVITPEQIYRSVNVKHYDYQRTSSNGVGIIKIGLHLEEVRVTISENSTTTAGTSGGGASNGGTSDGDSSTPSAAPTPAAEPSGQSPVNGGTVNPYSAIGNNGSGVDPFTNAGPLP